MAEVSFGGFSRTEGSPIYSQIVRYIKAGIVAGTVADGDEFPSRRALSALLGVNPNTIQKACRLLEEDALALVRTIRAMGATRQEAGELLDRLWDAAERRSEDG